VATVLGVNAVFHDPSAALLVDGKVVAAEEERFSRRKHGKDPVAFSTWELPQAAARWALRHAGVAPRDLDAVAYSYDPDLATAAGADVVAQNWEGLRTLFVQRAPLFLKSALPGLDAGRVRFVRHHVAHAASAYLCAPFAESAVMVVDGRGERGSFLAGAARDQRLEVLAAVRLPSSLGLLYETATEHLGFRRSSDEYKVMALAAYGEPVWADELAAHIRLRADGGFENDPVDWRRFTPPGRGEDGWTAGDANLAASLQHVLQETLHALASRLHERTGLDTLTMAGGVALNCVANSYVLERGPFSRMWVQPAAGDAGTALGAAAYVAAQLGDTVEPMTSAALGRDWAEDDVAAELTRADVSFYRPRDIAAAVARVLADDGIVAWVQGRSEWGPRALGHRSLLANANKSGNLARLNDVKGREQFRPVAPMVLTDRAAEIFDGPLPSPFMLFTHRVRPEWLHRIPAVVHVDGTARIQTVDRAEEPLVAAMLTHLERLTGTPVCVNTSLNTGGRPMVDSPVDALECFGSSPIDALAIGPFLVERAGSSRIRRAEVAA
jgi:carbamoyltransferase